MVHDRSGQAVVLDQDERVVRCGRCSHVRACFLKRISYIHANEHFVLNHENRAPAECGKSMWRHLCAAKRKCQGAVNL